MRKPFFGSEVYCEKRMFRRGFFFLFFITLSFFADTSGSLAATCGLGNNNTYDSADQITEAQKCNPGTVKNFTETSTGWSWSCEDGNYPTLVNCSAMAVSNLASTRNEATCSDKYVRTDDTSQVKIGALGIRGMFIAYGGMKVNNRRVQNVANPTDGTDAATKSYVDSEIAKAKGGGGSGGVAGGCSMEISRVVSFYTTVSDVWGNGCNPSSTTGTISNDTCQKQSASGYICGELYSQNNTSQNTDITNKGCLCVKEKSASEVVSGEVSGGCSLIFYDSGSYNMALKNSWGIGCIPEYYTGGRQKAECRQNAISGYECGRVSHQISGTETTFGCLCKKK